LPNWALIYEVLNTYSISYLMDALMDEGSRGQFLNIDRTLIQIQEEIEVFQSLSDLCQHRTLRPLLKHKGNPSEFSIPFGFPLVEGAGGDKANFSFYMGGAIVQPSEAEAANRFYRVPQQQLSLVA
jgi:hypothetical protein